MLSLLVTLRDILVLRRGPQDMPYSPVLLAIAALASLFVSQWATTVLLPQRQDQLLSVAAALALHLGLLYLLLNALQRQARFVQTAAASLSVDVVFTAAMLPALMVVQPLFSRSGAPPPPEALTGGAFLASLLLIGLAVWRIVVDAHILRQTLEIRLMPALLINMALLFAGQIVLSALFGGAEGN
ncbi:hypothetical protein [Tahibacter caeni]|uniref:hypothetical protein n=1 Tax=Tahibacter caeni TaxID=1453545 RepID=UPI0021489870|nr:hypothetical protein [Tahibacter caeni]